MGSFRHPSSLAGSEQDSGAPNCEPPREYRHRDWHWLHHPRFGWFCAQSMNGLLWTGPDDLSSEAAYDQGWRYVEPAIPPTVMFASPAHEQDEAPPRLS